MKWPFKHTYILSFVLACYTSTSIADQTPASKAIQPVSVHNNEILVHKSELCPQNSTVESQLSPTGDIIIWCSEARILKPIHPIAVRPNQFLLRGAELCPQSLMAIDTKISSSGDILIWCAEEPKATAVEES